jgi:hypothetical protein
MNHPRSRVSPSTSPHSSRIDTPPSPARMAAAIAAFPYSPKVAILDIIDNSIEAGSDVVSVEFGRVGKSLASICIIDHGAGVDPGILDEVLRAGSRTSHLYNAQSLSRYGIGLKGAGFSLGKRITVLTRFQDTQVARRAIDLEQIEVEDTWFQETREPSAAEEASFQEALDRLPGNGEAITGTVVIIEKLNVLSKDISRLKSDLVRAAGETYGKFLGTGAGAGKLRILIDGTEVEGVDPLHREHPDTVVLIKREQIEIEGGSSAFLTAVALPHPNKVSDEVRKKHRYTQAEQGISIYRNGRLVRTGETLGLFGKDFHLNAYRAELEYTTPADRHITVDVAKSTVVVSQELMSKLQQLVISSTRTADVLWREKDVLTQEDISSLFDESNRLISSRQKLLVQDLKQRKASARAKDKSGLFDQDETAARPMVRRRLNGLYLRPVDSLPEDVLYRPLLDATVGGLVIEVNLSHPFSKAVFEVSPGEAKKAVPRRATTAVQQLLYILGYCEDGLSDEQENRELFGQFRRYLSMNLRALLAD